MRWHFFAGTAVDDDRFGSAKPFGRARHIERRVAAAINHHPPAQHRLLRTIGTLHRTQYGHRIEDARGILGGNIGALGNMRANCQEGRVVTAFLHRFCQIEDLGIQLHRHTHRDDALHLRIQHRTRQPVFGYAKAHHAAEQRAGLEHSDGVTQTAQLIGRRHA